MNASTKKPGVGWASNRAIGAQARTSWVPMNDPTTPCLWFLINLNFLTFCHSEWLEIHQYA